MPKIGYKQTPEHILKHSLKNKTHGKSNDSIYRNWIAMRERCLNKKHRSYKHYGEKGITICERWLKFENFYKDMGERISGMTIDRIDNTKGYSPENCRWASFETQNNNRSNNFFVEYNDQTKTLSQWAAELGLDVKLLWDRIKRQGWSIEKSFSRDRKGVKSS